MANNTWYFVTANTYRADDVLWHLKDENIDFGLDFEFRGGKRFWRFAFANNLQSARARQIVEQSA